MKDIGLQKLLGCRPLERCRGITGKNGWIGMATAEQKGKNEC